MLYTLWVLAPIEQIEGMPLPVWLTVRVGSMAECKRELKKYDNPIFEIVALKPEEYR